MRKIWLYFVFSVLMILGMVLLTQGGDTDTTDVNATINNVAPEIIEVATVGAQTPVAGSQTPVAIWFTAEDENGIRDLDNDTANISCNLTGETVRYNVSCTAETVNVTTMNYTCSIKLWYWDGTGNWQVNASVEDLAGNHGENITTSFSYGSLLAMNMSPEKLTFGNLDMGDVDKDATNDPLNVTNLGNTPISQLSVKGYNLTGLDYPSDNIGVGNFAVNVTNVSCGTTLVDSSAVTVPDSSIAKGNGSSNQIYVYLDVPFTLRPQTYKSQSAWIITAS